MGGIGRIPALVMVHALFTFHATKPDECVDRETYSQFQEDVDNFVFFIEHGAKTEPFSKAVVDVKDNRLGADSFKIEQRGDDYVILRSDSFNPLMTRYHDRLKNVDTKHSLYSPTLNIAYVEGSKVTAYETLARIASRLTKREADSGEVEAVNSPSYYQSEAGFDAASVIRACTPVDGYRGFNKGVVIKYLFRHGKKNSADEAEDINKALWYLCELLSTYEGGVERMKKTLNDQLRRHCD